MFKVESYDEEQGEWEENSLEMCNSSRHCGCFDKGEMDICDYTFYDTSSEQVAKDKKEWLEEEGFKARIIEE